MNEESKRQVIDSNRGAAEDDSAVDVVLDSIGKSKA